MTLTETSIFPPGGFQYFEPEINWRCPRDTALIGLSNVARALQIARANNPWSGLNPSFESCLQAVKDYTCKRLNYDPRFCGPQPASQQRIDHSRPTNGRCAGCSR